MQDANRRRRHGWFAPSQEARQGGGREEDAKSRRHDKLPNRSRARRSRRREPARRAARDRALERGRDADAKLRGERTRERRERRGTRRTKRDGRPGGVGARGGGDAGDVERGRDARAAGRDENERVLGAEAVDAETNARGGGAGESARR